MSLIGTMMREPRVFAHDAIALSDLKDIYGALNGVTYTFAGGEIINQGTNYQQVATNLPLQGGSGGGGTCSIVADPVTGGVTDLTIVAAGLGYREGDIVTVGSPGVVGGVTVPMGDGNCRFEIQAGDLQAPIPWALGDALTLMPFSVPYNGLNWSKDKTKYTYEFGGATISNPGPPAALYIGADMDISVIMENPIDPYTGVHDKVVEFKGVKAGTVLPISVLTVTDSTAEDYLEHIIAIW